MDFVPLSFVSISAPDGFSVATQTSIALLTPPVKRHRFAKCPRCNHCQIREVKVRNTPVYNVPKRSFGVLQPTRSDLLSEVNALTHRTEVLERMIDPLPNKIKTIGYGGWRVSLIFSLLTLFESIGLGLPASILRRAFLLRTEAFEDASDVIGLSKEIYNLSLSVRHWRNGQDLNASLEN